MGEGLLSPRWTVLFAKPKSVAKHLHVWGLHFLSPIVHITKGDPRTVKHGDCWKGQSRLANIRTNNMPVKYVFAPGSMAQDKFGVIFASALKRKTTATTLTTEKKKFIENKHVLIKQTLSTELSYRIDSQDLVTLLGLITAPPLPQLH